MMADQNIIVVDSIENIEWAGSSLFICKYLFVNAEVRSIIMSHLDVTMESGKPSKSTCYYELVMSHCPFGEHEKYTTTISIVRHFMDKKDPSKEFEEFFIELRDKLHLNELKKSKEYS